MDNTIFFEDGDKALAREMLTSSSNFSVEDVKKFANIGAITVEDAKSVASTMESSMVTFDKAMKNDVMFKKALIVIAREKNDPDFKTLLELNEQMNNVYASLESKYGEEAKANQQTLVSKLLSKFRGDAAAQSVAGKVSDFQ